MEFITLTADNIDQEHICCAISDKKSKPGYEAKKNWLKEQFDDGYVFTKLDVRGKVFIEHCPSEIASMPIEAENYTVINCFWVSGRYKGQGYAKQLLDGCVEHSRKEGRKGIAVLCGDKKRPFLSDKKFFVNQGFQVCDTAEPYFELLYLPLEEDAPAPSFLESAKHGTCPEGDGFTVYYSHQCPYMMYYTDFQRKIAQKHDIPYETVLLDTREKGRNNPSPFTIFSLFYKGKFVTHELMSEKKLTKLIEDLV